jgi:hypothetical protein
MLVRELALRAKKVRVRKHTYSYDLYDERLKNWNVLFLHNLSCEELAKLKNVFE